jgi:hypothetical protein
MEAVVIANWYWSEWFGRKSNEMLKKDVESVGKEKSGEKVEAPDEQHCCVHSTNNGAISLKLMFYS